MSGPPAAPRGPAQEFARFLELQNLGLNLPFALAFLFAAANGLPAWETVALIVVAFVAARNAGHSFNRWADRRLDALNPRTRDRALVTGRYPPWAALLLTGVSSLILFLAAYLLNLLALALAPVALAIILGYSYTKRFTAWTTVVLGLVEAITPAAAYIAVTGALPAAALVAVGAVLLWGTAFETIHSLGDIEADRSAGLRSLPMALGIGRSVRLVPVLHAAAIAFFAAYAVLAHLGPALYVALVGMAGLTVVADVRLARHPTEPSLPFRLHFALGTVFLLGVLVALFVPGARF